MSEKSDYSPAESHMIMCITRERACIPEQCLRCGWLRDETRKRLNAAQAEWDRIRRMLTGSKEGG